MTGQGDAIFSAPTGTSLTTVLTGLKSEVALTSLDISATTTGADASVVVNNGTTDFYIANAVPVAANETLSKVWDPPLVLKKECSIKVQTSLADELHFSIGIAYLTGQ